VNGTKTTGLVATAVGAIFVYAGIKGFSILKATQNVIRGTAPGTGQKASLLSTGTVSAPTSTGPGLANPKAGNWSHDGLMKLWIANGGSPATANNAACHAIQESSGNASVTSANPDGGINVGLWQLDTRGVGAGHSVSELQNPNTNARIAIHGSNNGRNWSAWATPGC
jgi:Lysozyme like domain/Pertactin